VTNFWGHALKPILTLVMCCAAASALQAQQPGQISAAAEQLKVLQAIEPGLWTMNTRFEPERSSQQPGSESGCLSPQSVAEDLQDLLGQESDGLSCTGKLLANDEDMGVLQVSCPARSKKELQRNGRIFQAPPAVIEIRRLTATSFRVTSKAREGPRGASVIQVQDYAREGDCPQ
jgi:hypothetical protein